VWGLLLLLLLHRCLALLLQDGAHCPAWRRPCVLGLLLLLLQEWTQSP
jgi:hypothetical protein